MLWTDFLLTVLIRITCFHNHVEFVWIHILALNKYKMGSLIQISYFSCKTEHNKQRTPLVCYWERIIYSEVKYHFCQHNFMGRITYQMFNLHILVIWAISFKAHKTLSLEKQESLIILFSLYISRKGSISTKGFFFSL